MRFVRLVFLTAALACLASAEPVDAILKRFDAAAKDFHAFSAKMQQKDFTKIVTVTEESSAIVRLKRSNDKVYGIIRYLDKNPRTIHFDGNEVEVFSPNANQKDVYDAKKYSNIIADVVLLGFGTSGKDIRNGYTVMDGGPDTVNGRRTTRIELIPKRKEMKDLVAKIELWIPEGETNPIQVKATQPNGDYKLCVYSDVKLLTPPLKDSDFDYDPGSAPNQSTHVVRN
jgi:outer membrane lipoprotein-sorting protein